MGPRASAAIAWMGVMASGLSCTPFVDLDGLGSGTSETTAGSGGAPGAGGSGATTTSGSGASGGGLASVTATATTTGGRCEGPTGRFAIAAAPGLAGDGYLSNPACATVVHDFYPQPTGCAPEECVYDAIHVGIDPACSPGVVYRLFVRFDLSLVPTGCVQSAILRFFYVEKTLAAAYPARLFGIEDFVELDATDWTLETTGDFGEMVTPSTPVNTFVEADVTAAVVAASATNQPFVAFELRYDDEQQQAPGESGWYGIMSAENSEKQPQLEMVIAQ